MKVLKNDKKCYLFHLKSFFVLVQIFDFFGHVGKQLDEKAKVIFKIYDVIN